METDDRGKTTTDGQSLRRPLTARLADAMRRIGWRRHRSDGHIGGRPTPR